MAPARTCRAPMRSARCSTTLAVSVPTQAPAQTLKPELHMIKSIARYDQEHRAPGTHTRESHVCFRVQIEGSDLGFRFRVQL